MERKEWESDYKLIPMSEISEEAREIAKRWYNGVSDMNDIRKKHKLASDIMNYSRRRAKDRDAAIADKEKERLYWQQLAEAGAKVIQQYERTGCNYETDSYKIWQQLKDQKPKEE